MFIKLLAIDLDGTLLTSERLPHPASAQAVRDAASTGIKIVLASGRTYPSILPFQRMIGIDGPIVSANGAHTLDENGQEVAFEEVGPQAVELALRIGAERGIHVNAYTRDELLFSNAGRWAEMYQSRLRTLKGRVAPAEEIISQSISKVMFVGEPDQLRALRKELNPRLPKGTHFMVSEPEYLEILSVYADKATGIKKIAEKLGILPDQVAAIGDYANDIGMLQYAGYSGAVATALPEVKAVANKIVASNDEGGVADFVRDLIASNRETDNN